MTTRFDIASQIAYNKGNIDRSCRPSKKRAEPISDDTTAPDNIELDYDKVWELWYNKTS